MPSNTNFAKINANIGEEATSPAWIRIIGWLTAIFIVIMVILLIINYTITPIFQLNPGGPGYIPVPGFSDGKVYWDPTKKITVLKDTDTILGSNTENWSFALDLFIHNPLSLSTEPRVLFYRGPDNAITSGGDTLSSTISEYNVCMALTKDTNDMIVSIKNSEDGEENILVPNVPIQTPFRVGVVIMDNAMEVYLNGRLSSTRTFLRGPKKITGSFYPPTGVAKDIAKVGNLHIWSRIISPSEMRYATPALMSASLFQDNKIPASSSCLSSIYKDITGEETAFKSDISKAISSMKSGKTDTSATKSNVNIQPIHISST